VSHESAAASFGVFRHLNAENSALYRHGSQLRYHGDFDAGGMTIARVLAARVGWQPWRFAARDYEEACASLLGLTSFTGRPGDTPWDPTLAQAMERHGLRVEEETVLHGLLADLEAAH
jgi:uncharacterized protein (TIGR02679 family)